MTITIFLLKLSLKFLKIFYASLKCIEEFPLIFISTHYCFSINILIFSRTTNSVFESLQIKRFYFYFINSIFEFKTRNSHNSFIKLFFGVCMKYKHGKIIFLLKLSIFLQPSRILTLDLRQCVLYFNINLFLST